MKWLLTPHSEQIPVIFIAIWYTAKSQFQCHHWPLMPLNQGVFYRKMAEMAWKWRKVPYLCSGTHKEADRPLILTKVIMYLLQNEISQTLLLCHLKKQSFLANNWVEEMKKNRNGISPSWHIVTSCEITHSKLKWGMFIIFKDLEILSWNRTGTAEDEGK